MSHQTAIARKTPSAPMRWLDTHGFLVGDRKLDYGCGRGADVDVYGMEGYDPHWQPEEPEGQFDLITCTYVLNVVDEAAQAEILEKVRNLLAPGGRAFFTVRRDISREGQPGRGCFQRFVELELPLVAETPGFVIYLMSA